MVIGNGLSSFLQVHDALVQQGIEIENAGRQRVEPPRNDGCHAAPAHPAAVLLRLPFGVHKPSRRNRVLMRIYRPNAKSLYLFFAKWHVTGGLKYSPGNAGWGRRNLPLQGRGFLTAV